MVLLLLRIAGGVSLLTFMGIVMVSLLRDYRMAAEQVTGRKQVRGRLLVVANETSHPQIGSRLPLVASTSLGRAAGNTIQVEDRFASGEHALVVQRMGQWWLEDRQSSNGTHLNGVLIKEPVVLSSGDIIGIGSVQLQLELD